MASLTLGARRQKEVFSVPLKERFLLNPGSEKPTYHLVFDLKGVALRYDVGDCLGIYPKNDPLLVDALLTYLHATGKESVLDREGRRFVFQELLFTAANLSRLPPRLETLSLDAFCRALVPLLPRFYSIASSMAVVGPEAHLTVGLITPQTSSEGTVFGLYAGEGTCSHYLCKRLEIGEPVALFHQPTRHFALPAHSFDKPLIMIGPGTGVAPFRGFMQERLLHSQAPNWLFFGARSRAHDFFYREYWETLAAQGHLELDLAFSRDQEERLYVQHRLQEKSAQVWRWLQEGAYLFVCGDASKMAKDVDNTLHHLIANEGQLTATAAQDYIKALKKAGRYQRDVY